MTNDFHELLTDWTEAERTGDMKALDALLTDDFVGIGPVGFVLDKANWLRRLDHGLRYERLDLEEVSSRRHGDTVMVVAHQRALGVAGETPVPADTRVSFTMVPDGGDLKIAGMQYSFIGPPIGAGR